MVRRGLDVRIVQLAEVAIALALAAAPASAEDVTAPDVWEPPEARDAMDEVELASGETLLGDFEGLENGDVFFDSDEFDLLDFDWEKIRRLRLTGLHVFRVAGGQITGTAEMRGDRIRIRTLQGEVIEIARDDVIRITPGGEDELSYWSLDLGAALSASSGNSDEVELSGDVEIQRDTGLTRWKSTYRGIYRKVEHDKTAENHRALTAFDVYLTDRLFVTTPFVEYFRDEFQNLRTRLTPGLSLGYDILERARVEWDIRLGAAYQYTEYFEGQSSGSDAAVVAGTDLGLDFTSDLELDVSYDVQLIVTDFDKTNHHVESELSYDLWNPVELDLTVIFDRVERPAAESDGSRPDENDLRLMVGLSIEL